MNTPKERIIETASILFHQQGYNSTGINQIIKEANVAKASFYQHFKTKDDLCLAFLSARHEYWFSELMTYISKSTGNKRRVLAAFDFIIYMNEKENFRGCSFLNTLSEISTEQIAILSVIQSHKKDLRLFFEKELGEELLSAHIYLLFESSIIGSQLYKSNELVEKSKLIVSNLKIMEQRHPLPPFTLETAKQKIQMAEDAWNSQNPEKVSMAYTIDSEWRNRNLFINGRQEIIIFLANKWKNELDYKLKKEYWAHTDNRIAVRFEYEYRNKDGKWFRAYGNENWEFDENGLMQKRYACINDLEINEADKYL